MYTSILLNGDWEMGYREEAYLGKTLPDFEGVMVTDAVPGYWEDMSEKLRRTPFYSHIRINPEYVIQRYPLMYEAADLALPNYKGNFFYRRTICLQEVSADTVLHAAGVQTAVSVWINGCYLGRHEGYSTPFDMEIPEGVLQTGENTIVLSISNELLEGQAGQPVVGMLGRAGNQYTGGVTGDIELRAYTCPLRDMDIRISEDCNQTTVAVDMQRDCAYEWSLWEEEDCLRRGQCRGTLVLDSSELERWSPEYPKLYTLRLTCEGGELSRTFGVRSLRAHGTALYLNGTPYYLRGTCEHGYFAETMHLPTEEEYCRRILKSLKKLGFNFLRTHTYVPSEAFMSVADEEGILLHIESPSNTTVEEWKQIVRFCRRHPSVVIYCAGNELAIDDAFIDYLHQLADVVHEHTDALFSPLSALRGVEYGWNTEELGEEMVEEPIPHNPRRFERLGAFSDLYSSYAKGHFSYRSLYADAKAVDAWGAIYGKPRISHEICIDGSYINLSMKDRYRGKGIGSTALFTSLEEHLQEKGLLEKAPIFFRNSCEWQKRIRKYCFEAIRSCKSISGYDFLGPIDTPHHSFGYDCGMMNEFYEMKPGESVRNVRMYNSATVLLTDLEQKVNYTEGDTLSFAVYASHYGVRTLENAVLTIRLFLGERVIEHRRIPIDHIPNGSVSRLYDYESVLPKVAQASAMKLTVTLDGGETYAENEWELYVFPASREPETGNLLISEGMSREELLSALREGKDVLLLGTEPFVSKDMEFRIALAGRTGGNLATVIYDHPLTRRIPHEGYCSWQFHLLMDEGKAVCFETKEVPFQPIVEVASSYKNAIRQAALFEFRALNGRLLVCGFRLQDQDAMAQWFRKELIVYVQSGQFCPKEHLSERQLILLLDSECVHTEKNNNFAMNVNDKAAIRKKRQEGCKMQG